MRHSVVTKKLVKEIKMLQHHKERGKGNYQELESLETGNSAWNTFVAH